MEYPRPYPTAESKRFWEELSQGRLMICYCSECRRPFFYPRAICPRCWGIHVDWVESDGRGTVVAYATVHRPGHPAFVSDSPYVSAVVELDVGVRLSVIVAESQETALGQRVLVKGLVKGGETIPAAFPIDQIEKR